MFVFALIAMALLSRTLSFTFAVPRGGISIQTARHLSKESLLPENGHLYVVATPIGNMGDISSRAISILSKCNLICAEDTRNTIGLLRLLQIEKKQLLSYHEHNFREKIPHIVQELRLGSSVAVVSDAGTPCISDPGCEIVAECHKVGIPVHAIPGPSAVVAALSVCGFQTNPFSYYGFIPVKGKECKEVMSSIINCCHTVVFYEAPHRIEQTFAKLLELDADIINRNCVICREITKLHEETYNGSVAQCLELLQKHKASNGRVKGEFTIVLGPYQKADSRYDTIGIALVKLQQDGLSRSTAVKLLADIHTKISKSEIYRKALDMDWE